jgi:ABC-type antimicrobial peptide transport system permease subunit
MGLRSLFRRGKVTVRIVLLLSIVFVLLTVSLAGSNIAEETTMSWVQKASGQNVVAIAHEKMVAQYTLLQAAFMGHAENGEFNYTGQELAISYDVILRLREVTGIVGVDPRLILRERISEIANFTIDPETLATIPVGDSREGYTLLVGVEPNNVTGEWFVEGRFLKDEYESSAVIGDSIAQTMFSKPLVQSIRTQNQQFPIVGVCVDPINNGRVAYVPLKKLQDATEVLQPNIVFAEIDASVDRSVLMAQINLIVSSPGSEIKVFETNEMTEKNIDFLKSTWSTIMLLPVFTLFSAALCLAAYMMLVIDEQRVEFGIIRALGAKSKTVTNVVTFQSAVILLSSFGFGLSLGIVTTLLILMPQPVVTILTLVKIASWLSAALAALFLVSLIPAVRLAKTSVSKMMA